MIDPELDAPNFIPWLQERLGDLPEFPVAYKSGQRRNKLYRAILEMLALPDCEHSYHFYQNLTEAIRALGLCVFTTGASVTDIPAELLSIIATDEYSMQDFPNFSIYPTRLLHCITGLSMYFGVLLIHGEQNTKSQKQLYCSFQDRNTVYDARIG